MNQSTPGKRRGGISASCMLSLVYIVGKEHFPVKPVTLQIQFCIVFTAWKAEEKPADCRTSRVGLQVEVYHYNAIANLIFKLHHLSPLYVLMLYQKNLRESEAACLSPPSTPRWNATHQF